MKKRTPGELFDYIEQHTAWDGECLVWTGDTNNDGYASVSFESRKQSLHRLSYLVHHGPIPDGKSILHTCDRPTCINPEHLRLGTQADNMHDMVTKGRHREQRKTHCPQNHPYDDENTYLTPAGHRQCRVCRRDHRRQLIA